MWLITSPILHAYIEYNEVRIYEGSPVPIMYHLREGVFLRGIVADTHCDPAVNDDNQSEIFKL